LFKKKKDHIKKEQRNQDRGGEGESTKQKKKCFGKIPLTRDESLIVCTNVTRESLMRKIGKRKVPKREKKNGKIGPFLQNEPKGREPETRCKVSRTR